MSGELTTALAGGAVGTVLLGAMWALLRVAAIPSDVRRHDEIIRVIDENLGLWVADDHRKLRRELCRVTEEMNGRGLLYSGAHGAARAEVKSGALHRYRDRLHESERELSQVAAHETWVHGLWRRTRGTSKLALRAPIDLKPVLDEWRAEVTQHASRPHDRAAVHDPTRWELQDLLEEVRAWPLEPQPRRAAEGPE